MFKLSATIRHAETQEGGVLLDILHGQMFSVNLVGAKILELIAQGCDEPQIAEEISRQFQVNQDVVCAHVSEFIEMLEKHHILEPVLPAGSQ